MWADISAGRITQSPVVRALTCLSYYLIFKDLYQTQQDLSFSKPTLMRATELQFRRPKENTELPSSFPQNRRGENLSLPWSWTCCEDKACQKPYLDTLLPADPLLFLQLHWPAWFFSINAAIPFFLLGNERVKTVFNSSTLAPWASKAITTETGKWKNRAPAPKLCLQTVLMLRKQVHCAVQNPSLI